MYWTNDGETIKTGTSAKDRLVAAAVATLLGGFLAAAAYRLDQDRVFDKPIEEILTTGTFWIGLVLGIGFVFFVWVGLLSSRTVVLSKSSNLARIHKSVLLVFRWKREIAIREIRAARHVTKMRDSINSNEAPTTHISWWLELVPESPKSTWFGKPVIFFKGPGRQATIDKAGEAHRLTGLPAYTPEGTAIW